jgi:hypothetical protein
MNSTSVSGTLRQWQTSYAIHNALRLAYMQTKVPFILLLCFAYMNTSLSSQVASEEMHLAGS